MLGFYFVKCIYISYLDIGYLVGVMVRITNSSTNSRNPATHDCLNVSDGKEGVLFSRPMPLHIFPLSFHLEVLSFLWLWKCVSGKM